MSRVFWDTNLFIYLFEDFGGFSSQVATLRSRMLTRGDELFTSAVTLGEILVKPMQMGDTKEVAYYQNCSRRRRRSFPLKRRQPLPTTRDSIRNKFPASSSLCPWTECPCRRHFES